MISHMRNCVTSEAVSDLIGKASIHPEKMSARVSIGFIFHVGGMRVKSIGQSSPGICPPLMYWGEGIGFRAPCSETEEQIIQECMICCRMKEG